jgi:hypothetical protein
MLSRPSHSPALLYNRRVIRCDASGRVDAISQVILHLYAHLELLLPEKKHVTAVLRPRSTEDGLPQLGSIVESLVLSCNVGSRNMIISPGPN